MKLIVLLAVLVASDGWSDSIERDHSVSTKGEFIILDNGMDTRVVVAPDRGGELTGFSVLKNDQWHELIYKAMDDSGGPGWRGKAPLLWPATGISLLEENQQKGYQLDGVTYEMPFHGFARLQPWKIVDKRQTAEFASVSLKLTDNELSHRYYPFGFEIQVKYRLSQNQLSMRYKVTAASGNTQAMPFSIGNHITFMAPLIAGSNPSLLEFENNLPDHLIIAANKTFSGRLEPSDFHGRHSLQELPRREAVSLSGPASKPELTIFDPSGFQLRLVQQASHAPRQPAVQFNLWADTRDGFFSPEPWQGTQNSLNTGAGLIELQAGHSWQWQIDIITNWTVQP
jgi:galactose mutarotase-like enzyme